MESSRLPQRLSINPNPIVIQSMAFSSLTSSGVEDCTRVAWSCIHWNGFNEFRQRGEVLIAFGRSEIGLQHPAELVGGAVASDRLFGEHFHDDRVQFRRDFTVEHARDSPGSTADAWLHIPARNLPEEGSWPVSSSYMTTPSE